MAEKDDHHTAEASEMFTEASFPATPSLDCDIVMKGGITSGVIYPLAVCQLAKTYRLRSVGGASAGAIAAAAAASGGGAGIADPTRQ
jgi:Patatin-like phospholipase